MRNKYVNPPNAVMLFAAGFGTRMGQLTAETPKPLIQVAGKPLIDHTLDLVEQFGPVNIVANLHYLPETLARHLAPKGVILSHEQPDILETGGGLRAALPLLGSNPVFTMNTDAIWQGPNPLSLLARHWNPNTMDALLVCLSKENALGYSGQGDFTIDEEGRATRGTDLVYGGVQIVKTDGLANFDEPSFSLNLLWDKILLSNRLFAFDYPGKWCDVGHPDGIVIAENLVRDINV